MDKFAQLAAAGSDISQAALGIDIRSGEELSQLDAVLRGWKELGMDYQILFLDANDETLVKRYKETRRSHPLSGKGRVESGIQKEREQLDFLKKQADFVEFLKTEEAMNVFEAYGFSKGNEILP